ncbi:ribosome small subunit-dependent GTPase A [Brevibacillus dissolubilis]|uniref:ribosome small subunit-dependent GTPase A n=1 Tax=Brevibacillus dissolubilis TaxID=1844116 RepID=UPI001116A45B|nr:ribosome small subunit-dependent GTPase A [Brevibacillus dissolubilis]
MPEGRIIKALSGYYYVADSDSDAVIQCRARGLFKKKGAKINPLVGDWVVYETTKENEQEGYVMEVGERTSELVRPPIANIELAVLVFSAAEPAFSPLLLDKFLVHTEHAGIDAIVAITKTDLISEEKAAEFVQMYEKVGYRVIPTSTRTGRGVDEVRSELAGKLCVFAGQSGVGKSSLINQIFPGMSLQTAEISHKLGRGRHTTRHVELIPLESEEGGYVADTPGFSSLEFMEMSELDLAESFRDFERYSDGCKFRGCLHLSEPSCAVREALEAGEIVAERYDNYKQFNEELKEYNRRNKPW